HSTSVETMAAHLKEAVESPRHERPELPIDLEQVVLRCLEKEPGRRFADVVAVAEALASCECRNSWSAGDAAEWRQSLGARSISSTLGRGNDRPNRNSPAG